MTHMNFFLDWKANAQFAGVIWALEHNLYKNAGLDVTLVPWDGVSLVTDHLESSGTQLSMASVEDNLFLKELDQGKHYFAVATMMQMSPIALMSKSETGVKLTREGLQGKRIGIHIDGRSMLQMLLNQCGLSANDIILSELGTDLEDFIQGRFDLLQCYCVIEPNIVRGRGIPVELFLAKDWGYQVYSQVMVCQKKIYADYKEEIAAFIRATFQGWKLAIEHPQTAASIICNKYCPDEDIALQEAMIQQLKPWIFDTARGYYNGEMTAERWLNANNMYVREGQVQKTYSPSDYAIITENEKTL